jgi:hypothetical protein
LHSSFSLQLVFSETSIEYKRKEIYFKSSNDQKELRNTKRQAGRKYITKKNDGREYRFFFLTNSSKLNNCYISKKCSLRLDQYLRDISQISSLTPEGEKLNTSLIPKNHSGYELKSFRKYKDKSLISSFYTPKISGENF